MRLVAIDFETFWDSKAGYTLSKMGPIEYIRDPRFEVQLLAWHDGKTGGVAAGDDVKRLLADLDLNDSETVTFAHNGAGFDYLILHEIYGLHPFHPMDTIPMAAWCGLTRIGPASHHAVTAALGTGEKLPGTVISDGKRWPEDFTPEERTAFAFYASQDAAQCLANAKAMLPYMTADAMKFIELTSRMACEPCLVLDRDMLLAYREELKAKTAKARDEIGKLFRFPDDETFLKAVRSKPAFCKMLEILGREAPRKLSEKKTKTKLEALKLAGVSDPKPEEYEVWEPALAKTDLDFRAMESDPDERVALLVRTRLENNSSMQASRTERFLALADGKPMPVMLQAFKAHTSRYTAGNEGKSDGLQMQNLSKRDPSLLTLRRAIKAPKEFGLVACDSSQVEARILAYVSDNWPLLEAFRTGADPYADLAEKIFGVPSKEIHDGAKGGDKKLKTYRNTGKTAILSAGYGVGWRKYADTLLRQGVRLHPDLDRHYELAKHAHSVYRQDNAPIVAFWKYCGQVIEHLAGGGAGYFGGPSGNLFKYGATHIAGRPFIVPSIEGPNGFILRYPGLRAKERDDGSYEWVYDRYAGVRKAEARIYGASLTENLCQYLAFALLMWQACRMKEQGVRIIANVHDSFLAACGEGGEERVKARMLECMTSVPDWLEGFPVGAEAETGTDFTIA
jgi:DNA polymerase